MKIILKNQADLARVLTSISMLAPEIQNKPYEVEIKPYKPPRSRNANAYFHVLVDKIAEKLRRGNEDIKYEMNIEYGTPHRIDEHTLFAFKAPKGSDVRSVVKYPKYMYSTIENGKELDVYTVYKETHTLNSGEMARLIDGVTYEAKQLGIETLDKIELKQMIESYKESI